MQKERQEKLEKEKEEKKRQEAEEMVRRMHEDTDSLEDRLAAVTEQQKDAKTSAAIDEAAAIAQVPDVVGETVEVDADTSSSATATNTDKPAKTNASTSSSEDIDEEMMEGEEGITKIGKDGES